MNQCHLSNGRQAHKYESEFVSIRVVKKIHHKKGISYFITRLFIFQSQSLMCGLRLPEFQEN